MPMIETTPAVAHRVQPQSNICWATCILMVREVVKGVNPDITPDKIVQRTHSASAGSNVSGQDSVIASAMYDWLGGGKLIKRPLTIAEIKTNIDANKPIIVGINWYKGGGHAVVIGGYDKKDGADWGLLKLFDPLASAAANVSTDRLVRGDYDPEYKYGIQTAGIGTSKSAGIWDISLVIP